jgi:hypothetical protein
MELTTQLPQHTSLIVLKLLSLTLLTVRDALLKLLVALTCQHTLANQDSLIIQDVASRHLLIFNTGVVEPISGSIQQPVIQTMMMMKFALIATQLVCTVKDLPLTA